MTKINHTQMMAVVVQIVLNELTDAELAGLNMCVALGNNPKQLKIWDKVEPLYTQENADGSVEVHDMTRIALNAVVNERLK